MSGEMMITKPATFTSFDRHLRIRDQRFSDTDSALCGHRNRGRPSLSWHVYEHMRPAYPRIRVQMRQPLGPLNL